MQRRSHRFAPFGSLLHKRAVFLTWIVKTLVGEFYLSCKHLCGIVAAVWLTLAAQKY